MPDNLTAEAVAAIDLALAAIDAELEPRRQAAAELRAQADAIEAEIKARTLDARRLERARAALEPPESGAGPNPAGSFECDECGFVAKSGPGLGKHRARHERERRSAIAARRAELDAEVAAGDPLERRCRCGAKFPTAQALARHRADLDHYDDEAAE